MTSGARGLSGQSARVKIAFHGDAASASLGKNVTHGNFGEGWSETRIAL